MALSAADFIKGIDFTALSTAAAGDHNTLVDNAATKSDSATEGKGLIIWTVDSALNTPVVPNPGTVSKWVRYLWLRVPHASATSTVPLLYGWNVSASSVATYLKWQRFESDNTTFQAQLDALDLRVSDLEAVNVTLQALVNAANSNAATANTNASAALSTANSANSNALQALSDLDTPTTGVKARVTSLETRVTSIETNITTLQTQITTINNTLSSGLGPVFIVPVTFYTGTAGIVYTTQVAAIPTNCKALIMQCTGEHNGDASVLARRDSGSSSYTLLQLKTNDAARPAYRSAQSLIPCTSTGFDLFVPATSGTTTVQLIGYVL